MCQGEQRGKAKTQEGGDCEDKAKTQDSGESGKEETVSSLYPAPQARTWSHVHEGSEDRGLQRILYIQRSSHMSEMPSFQEIHNSQGRILDNLFLWNFITVQLVNQKTNFLSIIIVCGESLRQDHSLQSNWLENWGYMAAIMEDWHLFV